MQSNLALQPVRGEPGVLALRRRQSRDRPEELSDDSGLAEELVGEATERGGVRRLRDECERVRERSIGFLHGGLGRA